ncbi:MAG: endonuclease III [Nitrospirae bacterium]|nr:endonuclease III [Nitrospirota bacterium]
MRKADIDMVMSLLKKQVKGLHVPWLEQMASGERDPFKILVSCILSLRTQDRTTGGASERLYRLASTPEEMAKLPVGKIEKAIYPVGFYRVKARTIRTLSREISEKYHSRVPDKIEGLLMLKGVGRKTANLVVTLGYDKPGICVDTHVHRITNRWAYVRTKTPEETEFALRGKLPLKYWKEINGLLVAFGQQICKPVSPLCSICSVNEYCRKRGVSRHR